MPSPAIPYISRRTASGGFAPLPEMAGAHLVIGPPDGIERRCRPAPPRIPCAAEPVPPPVGEAPRARVRTTDVPVIRQFPRFIASIAPCCFHHAVCDGGTFAASDDRAERAFAEAVRRDVIYFFGSRLGRLDDDARDEAIAAVDRIISEAFQCETERAAARSGSTIRRSHGLAAIADAVGEAIMDKNFQIWAHEEQLHQMRAALRRSVLSGLGYSPDDLAALDRDSYRALMEKVQAEVEHRLRIARSHAAINGIGTA